MKSHSGIQSPQEVELKLALPGADPVTLARRLAQIPILARRKSTRLHLHNIYFDTPDSALRQQRVALRLRRLGGTENPKWLQTLKTAGRSDSALSQRGEWETPVRGTSLSLKGLQATPWSDMDPDGKLFRTLAPVFETNFERTVWLLRRPGGSVIELALDIGQILHGERVTPICELELELKAGPATALFEVADQIAASMAVLPASASKAERGYALAQGAIHTPLRARPQRLPAKLPHAEMAQRVMQEMFSQFTGNLNSLLVSDDPELVHQARVGWRRFKSARRLFAPLLAMQSAPSWQALLALLTCLGKLRDLDVARVETLPAAADAYIAADPRRAELWQSMTTALAQAANLQRKAVRYALQDPAVGACLLATTQWLEGLNATVAAEPAVAEPKGSLRRWTKGRIKRLHQQLRLAGQSAAEPAQAHRVRILAKRMRYNLEALESLLPGKQTQAWLLQASKLQAGIGARRDAMQAAILVSELELDRGLAEFLRGLALGRNI
jgi:inorganic triphosphatase YgiF